MSSSVSSLHRPYIALLLEKANLIFTPNAQNSLLPQLLPITSKPKFSWNPVSYKYESKKASPFPLVNDRIFLGAKLGPLSAYFQINHLNWLPWQRIMAGRIMGWHYRRRRRRRRWRKRWTVNQSKERVNIEVGGGGGGVGGGGRLGLKIIIILILNIFA